MKRAQKIIGLIIIKNVNNFFLFMEGRQSFFLGPQDECPQCGDDYYVKDAPADQEYQGVLVKGDKALICKRCERLGLDDGLSLS